MPDNRALQALCDDVARTVEITLDTADAYYGDTAYVSNSMLKTFSRSRYAYWCYYVAKTHVPPPPTPAMLRGTMLHSCVFEPGFFESLCVAPKCDRRTNVGKTAYAEFLAASEGKTIVNAEDYAEIAGMYGRLREHNLASALLWCDGPVEHVLTGQCELTGIPIKGRLDKLADTHGLIVDLKNCADPSAEAFSAQAFRLGYFRQADYYRELWRQKTGDVRLFVFVCISAESPHRIGLFEASESAIALGRAQNEIALAALKECLDSGDFADPAEKAVVKIDAPRWAERAMEEWAA